MESGIVLASVRQITRQELAVAMGRWWQRFSQSAQSMDMETFLELLRVAIIVVALLSLSWLAARWTWSLLPAPAPATLSFDAIDVRDALFVTTPEYKTDIQHLRAQSLFGQTTVQQPNHPRSLPPTPAPEAKMALQLQLRGVVYSSNQEHAAAVIGIANKSGQELYRVGEELPGSSASVPIKLMAVEYKRVRILHGEAEELLELYIGKSPDQTAAVKSPPPVKPKLKAKVVDRRQDRRAVEIATRYARTLQENPAALKDVIEYTPARRGDNDGELIGFRIRPKQNARDFYLLGLRANDVVTAVNGVELNNYAALAGAQSAIASGEVLSILVLRRERPHEIILGLNQ